MSLANEVAALSLNLLNAAKFHDWNYSYSDDYNLWSIQDKQRKEMDRAFNALAELDKDMAFLIWNRIAPENWKRMHY